MLAFEKDGLDAAGRRMKGGSVETMTLPDGRAETINAQDANTQLPTEVTRLDGKDVTQSLSPTGQTTSQGIGDSKSAPHITPATYQYDPLTGKLSGMTLFPTGSTSNTTGQEITGWKYDPATSLLSTKTYANGSTDTFTYNNKLQLSAENLRGDSASFNYNSAGMRTGASYNGNGTTINDSLGTLDDLGRSHVMTETTTPPGGATTSTADILGYTQQGQVSNETQASGVTVHYDYNADSSIKDMQLKQGSVVISETDYAYDPISKRLQTITINGVTYTYTYKTGTNLVSSVGTSANTVSYGYESNTGRLQSISATGSTSTDYGAGYTYTDNDQRLTENVLQENPDTQANDQHNWTFGYDGQDELASASQGGTTLYSYNYDGVGNRTDAGSVNAMNQYGSLQYNGQGDVIDDGQFNYTWDSKGRLTSAQPDWPDAQSQKEVFTYDPENRRTQEDIYTWDADNQDWAASSTLKFVYDGSQMVAKLNGQNQLLQSYAWGPDGRLMSITDYSGGTPKNYQVVTDGSGNAVELLDSSTGLVAASYQYDPWGNPISATGPAANVSPFRWQGELYDANFGGYYMGAREGSARLHIFLSPDPSGEGSDPNLERIVGNDPINKADPTGLTVQQAIENKLAAQAAADHQFDVEHGGWMSASGLPNSAQQQLDFLKNNPQYYDWFTRFGSDFAFLRGDQSSPFPTRREFADWNKSNEIESNASIDIGMIGWHEDVGFGERFIPVWGSGKQALANFGRGEIVEGIANSYLAATDFLIVRSLIRAGANLTAGLARSAAVDAVDASAGSSRLLTSSELLATGRSRKGMVYIPWPSRRTGSDAVRIGVNEVTTYKDFYRRGVSVVGDEIAGHELLQNAWLRQNGVSATRGVSHNPIIALDAGIHEDVSALQLQMGLHDPSLLSSMSASQNIEMNSEILRSVGVPENTVQKIRAASIAFARTKGLIR